MNTKSQKKSCSNGHKKMWLYFEDIIKKDGFQKEMIEMRREFGVPKNGFLDNKDSCRIPPIKWKNKKMGPNLFNRLEKISQKYGLIFSDWWETIEIYFFYNKTEELLHLDSHDMCMTTDLIEESCSNRRKTILEENKHFPVIIKINPYAGQRNIIDYIKRTYPLIKRLQEKYRDKNINIGKQRKRDPAIQKRNDFIYKNRDKPLKEISKLVSKNFDSYLDIDQGSIGKIISLEKKKRN